MLAIAKKISMVGGLRGKNRRKLRSAGVAQG